MPASSFLPGMQFIDLDWLRWLAASTPNRAKLQELIENSGTDWRASDGCGAFVWALRQQRKHSARFVQALLAEGFDPDEPQGSVSPLFEACYQGNLKSLKILLSAGADPNAQGGAHPLGQACLGEKREMFIAELIRAGANIQPALRFEGIVLEMSKQMDKPYLLDEKCGWNALAQLVFPRSDQWTEFKRQMKSWSEDCVEPGFDVAMARWLAIKESELMKDTTLAVSSMPTVTARRI